jgi:hypothetical protein
VLFNVRETRAITDVTHEHAHRPSPRARAAAAALIAVGTWLFTAWYVNHYFRWVQASDYTYVWLAAKAIARGADPYAFVAHASTPWVPVLLYPLPAGMLNVPLADVDLRIAAPSFVALGAGWLAYVVSRDGWWRLLIFASGAFYWNCISGQWSPLLIAAALCGPAAGIGLVTKPNFALPLLTLQRDWRGVWLAVAVAVAIGLVSLALQPAWPLRWLATVRGSPESAQYIVPGLTVWGAPALLSVLRLRNWRGRLLFAMALTPQNAFGYSQMPLLVIPRKPIEMVTACVASWLAYALVLPMLARARVHDPASASSHAFAPYVFLLYYLPALVVVFRTPQPAPQPPTL